MNAASREVLLSSSRYVQWERMGLSQLVGADLSGPSNLGMRARLAAR